MWNIDFPGVTICPNNKVGIIDRVSDKGPFKNYVILLGGGGRSPKDYIRLQGGDTPKDYIGLHGGPEHL